MSQDLFWLAVILAAVHLSGFALSVKDRGVVRSFLFGFFLFFPSLLFLALGSLSGRTGLSGG